MITVTSAIKKFIRTVIILFISPILKIKLNSRTYIFSTYALYTVLQCIFKHLLYSYFIFIWISTTNQNKRTCKQHRFVYSDCRFQEILYCCLEFVQLCSKVSKVFFSLIIVDHHLISLFVWRENLFNRLKLNVFQTIIRSHSSSLRPFLQRFHSYLFLLFLHSLINEFDEF